MQGAAMMNGWARVRNGCAIDVQRRDDHVELTFGGPQGDFMMVIEVGALPALNKTFSAALAQVRASSPETAPGTV